MIRPLAIVVGALVLLAACSAATPPPLNDAAPPEYRDLPVAPFGEGVEPPRVVKRVEPRLPDSFIGTGRSAVATVEAVINTAGEVEAVWYVKGDREWAAAVAEAARRWRFEPARQNGEPVAVRFVLTMSIR